MLTVMTLAHTLALLVLPVAILLVRKFFKNRVQASETPCLKPDLAEVPPTPPTAKVRSPSPSLPYHLPAKAPQGQNHAPKIEMQHSQSIPQVEIGVKQPYDAFLVLDVEATCCQGTGFDWANEIIEWPVCLLRWKEKSTKGRASRLEVVGEFRTFVKPKWRPQLSQFCTELTGITQEQVDSAPTFPKVLEMFAGFLVQHGLINRNGRSLQRFCWCSDGPFDVRDFVVKQCFISNVPLPPWLRGDVLDVRKTVSFWEATNRRINRKFPHDHHIRSLNITQQLRILRLGPFQGRIHSGIDDTRNVARIIIELAQRGIRLEPNTPINPNRRWQWMGRPGEVLEHYFL